MAIDNTIVLKAVDFHIKTVVSELSKSFTTPQTKLALQTGTSAIDSIHNHGKSLAFAKASIREDGGLPTNNIPLLRHVVDALDAWHGHVAAQQIDDNKEEELDAIDDTKTTIEALPGVGDN